MPTKRSKSHDVEKTPIEQLYSEKKQEWYLKIYKDLNRYYDKSKELFKNLMKNKEISAYKDFFTGQDVSWFLFSRSIAQKLTDDKQSAASKLFFVSVLTGIKIYSDLRSINEFKKTKKLSAKERVIYDIISLRVAQALFIKINKLDKKVEHIFNKESANIDQLKLADTKKNNVDRIDSILPLVNLYLDNFHSLDHSKSVMENLNNFTIWHSLKLVSPGYQTYSKLSKKDSQKMAESLNEKLKNYNIENESLASLKKTRYEAQLQTMGLKEILPHLDRIYEEHLDEKSRNNHVKQRFDEIVRDISRERPFQKDQESEILDSILYNSSLKVKPELAPKKVKNLVKGYEKDQKQKMEEAVLNLLGKEVDTKQKQKFFNSVPNEYKSEYFEFLELLGEETNLLRMDPAVKGAKRQINEQRERRNVGNEIIGRVGQLEEELDPEILEVISKVDKYFKNKEKMKEPRTDKLTGYSRTVGEIIDEMELDQKYKESFLSKWRNVVPDLLTGDDDRVRDIRKVQKLVDKKREIKKKIVKAKISKKNHRGWSNKITENRNQEHDCEKKR